MEHGYLVTPFRNAVYGDSFTTNFRHWVTIAAPQRPSGFLVTPEAYDPRDRPFRISVAKTARAARCLNLRACGLCPAQCRPASSRRAFASPAPPHAKHSLV